jgi:putative FmdB family regulatory protein
VPTYQYACTACGQRLEVVQAFTDAALTECPECAGRLRKVYSSVGVVFKGSGFYRTDSRSAPPKDGADSAPAKDGAAKSTGSGGTSADSASTSGPSTSKPAAGSGNGGSSSSSTPSSTTGTAA